MGITVWQRHNPGQLVSVKQPPDIESKQQTEDLSTVETGELGAITNDSGNAPALPAVTAVASDPVSVAGTDSNILPPSIEGLLSMTLAEGVAAPDDGKILVLCPPRTGSGESPVLSGDALRLLQKMIAAIELAPADWSQLPLNSTATDQQQVASTFSLQQLLAKQRIPGLLLLLPQQMMLQGQTKLNTGCDHHINEPQSHVSGQGQERILAGLLPSSRCAFACLHHPQDLLANGALKRDASEMPGMC